MAKNLYYFRPSALLKVLRQLPRSYRLVALDRDQSSHPDWTLPAVLVADAREDHLKQIERLAPEGGSWRLIYFLQGNSLPKSRFNGRLFAVLPRQAPRAVLERAVESAFDTLQMEEERRRTRQQLHLVATELETLNKIGVALSTERNTDCAARADPDQEPRDHRLRRGLALPGRRKNPKAPSIWSSS